MSKATELLNRKQPNTAFCEILMVPALADTHRGLRVELADAEAAAELSSDREPRFAITRLKARIAETETQIRAETETFTFSACGTLRFRELLEDCPATELDQRGGLDYEANKFGPLLIAECATEPTFTETEANRLWAEFGDAEVSRIFNTAMAANRVVRDVPFTLPVTDPTEGSGRNSIIAAPEESPTGTS